MSDPAAASSLSTSRERVAFSLDLRQRIVEHARAESPRECCGIVAGRDGQAREAIALTNIAPGIDFYRIDDSEVYCLFQRLDREGDEIVAMYHSHPTSAANPSPTDIALAYWPDSIYLICSLVDEAAPDLRGFRIVDQHVTEIELVEEL